MGACRLDLYPVVVTTRFVYSFQEWPQSRLFCKQLRDPRRYGDTKNRAGHTLLHHACRIEDAGLAENLLRAGVAVTVVNAGGDTAWKTFVRSWATTNWARANEQFYSVLKTFIERLGESVDITCVGLCESTLHAYGEILARHEYRSYFSVPPGYIRGFRPGVNSNPVHCLFLLLNAGCRVNTQDTYQELPFQTSVFGKPDCASAVLLLDVIWIMLAAAGSRLCKRFGEMEKLAFTVNDYLEKKTTADLLSFHGMGLLTAHTTAAKARLRSLKTPVVSNDVIAKLCRPLTLQDLCLSCIRMNCHPNAFVAASKLPLPPPMQEAVRPYYQKYSKQFGRTAPDVVVIKWLDGRQTSVRLPFNPNLKVGDFITF